MKKNLLTAKLREGANAYREAIPSLLEMAGNDISSIATNALTEIDFLMRGADPGSYACSRLAYLMKCSKNDPPAMLQIDRALVNSKYSPENPLIKDLQKSMDRFAKELKGIRRVDKERLRVLYDSCLNLSKYCVGRFSGIDA